MPRHASSNNNPHREGLALPKQWYVSVSPRDAVAAANDSTCDLHQLELAGDPENHPRCIDLPGGWQYGLRPLVAREDDAAAPGAPTGATPTLTQDFVGHSAHAAAPSSRLPHHWLTYAKRVLIPHAWDERTIFLHLDNARYHVTVRVNGKQVHQHVGGLEPHRIDISSAVLPGTQALIELTVGDVGVSGHRNFDPHNFTGTRLPTCKEIENNLVHPVLYGGFDGRQVQRVWLESVPKVRVEYVFANPKVSTGQLHYRVALRNDTDQSVAVRCLSQALPDKELLDQVITLPPRKTRLVETVVEWHDAILWDTDHPHLYPLRTRLQIGPKTVDEHHDTFGFREFTINGHSFFLNGKKIHLHGNSGHSSPEQESWSVAKKAQFLRDLKRKFHVNHIRLHARPLDPRWVEAADRVGMLITTETALWTTGFHSFDWVGSEQKCYENVRTHFLEALVRRDRNRPSVVIWSLSNEMSPITPFDLEQPKMAAMTRVFEKILAEAQREDDSRVIQMSSAMDFVGRLKMYNLHYPKNWQAFPDYPHTAYWLDGAFLFPWYGQRRNEMPAWNWRKDKPLYFGEYTCVFGATPDNQASIVGDIAFDQPDGGSQLVQEKLWGLEAKAYRRRDVSGFCAWSFALGHDVTTQSLVKRADVRAYAHAIRPLAVLDHSYRTRYFSGDEVVMDLSIHNDTRQPQRLSTTIAVNRGKQLLWEQSMPARHFEPAENLAFTSRFRTPRVERVTELSLAVTLRAGRKIVDQWSRSLWVHPQAATSAWPDHALLLDPDQSLRSLLGKSGVQDLMSHHAIDNLSALPEHGAGRSVWINFDRTGLVAPLWNRHVARLRQFVATGGTVILDRPPEFTSSDLPVKLKNGKGYADGRLEITYAYNIAPHHPLMKNRSDADFSLWGVDYYLARRCLEIPQEGNARALLVAGTDRAGLVCSPLMELDEGIGRWMVSTLELIPKLSEEPLALPMLLDMLSSSQGAGVRSSADAVGVAVAPATLRILREVGYAGSNQPLHEALTLPVAIVDGDLIGNSLDALHASLTHSRIVYLHNLTIEQTQAVLAQWRLPGVVRDGAAGPREYDTIRHTDALTDGLSSTYLHWIVGKAKLAAWTPASLHPQPASAVIELPRTTKPELAVALTRRGAVVSYRVGSGRLIIDNLQWQRPDFDEPERPRRYVMAMLTNLGVELREGAAKRFSEDFETEAERRERGHF